jgi:hypothetical protein
MRMVTTIPVALSLVIAANSASALTIDNFEEGPFSVSDLLSGETSITQSGLSTLNVISGQRTVVVQSSGSIATTATLALTAGDDAADLAGDPNPPGAISGFRIEYAFEAPYDLTQGGSLDRLVVDVSAASGTPELRFNLFNGESIFATPSALVSGPGAITIPFSDFFQVVGPPAVLDFTQVNEIRLIGQVYGSLSVANIAVVPGPSTALLLGSSMLGLAARVRRRRAD